MVGFCWLPYVLILYRLLAYDFHVSPSLTLLTERTPKALILSKLLCFASTIVDLVKKTRTIKSVGVSFTDLLILCLALIKSSSRMFFKDNRRGFQRFTSSVCECVHRVWIFMYAMIKLWRKTFKVLTFVVVFNHGSEPNGGGQSVSTCFHQMNTQ